MNTYRRISLLACTLGLLAAAMPASAQSTYPDHPVKLLVALPAGGGVDIIARLVGQKLAAATGQPFVVDNRAGASGRIGLPVVAKAAPDGYTLMASPASFLTTNKSIFKELPYDPQADFAPITKLANQSMVLVVRDKQKFASAGALLAAAKANPGALNYASSGDGSPQHLAALMFETRAGVKMTHVPYKGGALAITDLLGGNVDLLFAPLPEALPYLKSGKLSALALAQLGGDEAARWNALNQAYRARFGFPFILCIRRHTRASALQAFAQRLQHDRSTELATTLGEIAAITRLRLDRLVSEMSHPASHGTPIAS